MSIIDIIIILLIAAMAVFGFYKGFIKSVISLLGFLVSLVIAILLARAVANALIGVDSIGDVVAGPNGSLYSWLHSKLPKGLEDITTEDIAAASDLKKLFQSEAPWFFKLFYPIVAPGLSNQVYIDGLQNARQIMALELAYGIFTFITGVVLFAVIRVLAAVFSLVLKKHTEGKKLFVGRIAGAGLGAVKAVIYCMIILSVFSMISNFSFMQPVNKELEKAGLASTLSSASVKITTVLLEDKKSDERYKRLVELVKIPPAEEETEDA